MIISLASIEVDRTCSELIQPEHILLGVIREAAGSSARDPRRADAEVFSNAALFLEPNFCEAQKYQSENRLGILLGVET